jgi:hypothetical protein
VKFNRLNSILPILLLAFFTAFGNPAIAGSGDSIDLNSRDFDYLQADQNQIAIFFKEISGISLFQVEPDNNSGNSGGNFEKNSPSLLIKYVPNGLNSWTYLQDLRKFLGHQIFPFNFFW